MGPARESIERAKASQDLREVAQRYTALKRWARQEWAGPCPRCGGTDRFHVHALGWWKCYQCHPRRADVIELVRWAERCSFTAAYWQLGGAPTTSRPTSPARQTERRRTQGWTSSAWRLSAEEEVAAAAQRLDTIDGGVGWRYLAGRGLVPFAWCAWGIGMGVVRHARLRAALPAIVIPWRHGGLLTAVAYRFLPGRCILKKADRFRQAPGGQRWVYGSELLGSHFRTLILVEGELNAVSIWQAVRGLSMGEVDVLSFGSEGNVAGGPAMEIATGYERVIVWADRQERATEALEVLGTRACGLQSPRGMDANDLLRAGLLPDFLQEVLPAPVLKGVDEAADTRTGQPASTTGPIVRDVCYTEDPRPDLIEDSTLWTTLLSIAYPIDGDDSVGCFGALFGARTCGAELEVQPDGTWRLRRGEVDEAEWNDYRQRWLVPHEAAIRRLLVGRQAGQPPGR